MITYGSPERVYVENERCDGPRAGVADIGGTPHRFKSLFDEKADEYIETFMVWPIDQSELALEIEQWGIFVEWNAVHEAGQATTESHPGHGGRHARWDEIAALLKTSRCSVPPTAKRATAQLSRIERDARYATSGPDYMLSWSIL